MKTLTVDQEMGFGPCYTRARVKKLFAGRARLHFRTIAKLDIPAKDRLWTLLHMMDTRQLCEATRRFGGVDPGQYATFPGVWNVAQGAAMEAWGAVREQQVAVACEIMEGR